VTLAEPRTPAGQTALAALIADPAAATAVLDFDGTLSAIEIQPQDAHPVQGAAAAVAGLAGVMGRVALLTGRPAAVAAQLSGVATDPTLSAVTVLGQYGDERWETGTLTSPPPAPGIALARARLPGLLAGAPAGVHLEDKGLSLVVHTRPAVEPQAALDALTPALLALAAETGLEPESGSLVLELRSPGGDKGSALRRWAAEVRAGAVLYAGDDDGDIPVLAAAAQLRASGVPVLVLCAARGDGSMEFRAGADLVVDGPAGVVEFLDGLLAAIGSGG
jgi:trehalose 6-phosphate phosphatase